MPFRAQTREFTVAYLTFPLRRLRVTEPPRARRTKYEPLLALGTKVRLDQSFNSKTSTNRYKSFDAKRGRI
jgi:hypothetical protein